MTDRTAVTTIGETIVFKGELSGDEDLVIDGQVEGGINLNQNALTVGEHGKVKATVVAKTVVVAGEVRGNIVAAEKVGIRDMCSMEGNICTPRLVIALGPISVAASTCGSRKGEGRPRRPPPTAAWTRRTNHARRTLRSRSPSGLFLLLLTRR